MIGEDLVVTSYKRKPFWASRIPDSLSVDCYADFFIAVQDRIQVRQILSGGILQANA